tara:strand:- start:2196 stop:2813 length:618 start_codon:yes stop_codon:yes gene_type:complete
MNKNILTFDEWAVLGKDQGMERGHNASVQHMLKNIFTHYEKSGQKYSIIDLGCGNGWVVRKFKEHSLCKLAHGLDGANNMIKKAYTEDSNGTYFNEDIATWVPNKKYDVVFSMETLYYFEKPEKIIKKIYNDILNTKGILIIGVDHYLENPDSLNWGKKFNLDITTLSINQWKNAFKKVGFNNIESKQVEANNKWNGTLIIKGEK